MPEMPKETEPTLLMQLLFSFQGPTLKTFVQTLPLTSKHLSNESVGPFGMLQAELGKAAVFQGSRQASQCRRRRAAQRGAARPTSSPIKQRLGGPGIVLKAPFKSQYGKLRKI